MDALLQELLTALCEGIRRGDVVADTSEEAEDRAHDLLGKRYPLGFSGLGWDQVPWARSYVLLSTDIPGIVKAFDEFLGAASITPDQFVGVVGDADFGVVFRIRAGVFRQHLCDFVALPQSTYVFTENAEWCFVYTLSETAYFGKAVK